ncbi:MAG: hypothetical protein IIB26_02640 [Chloroflexi bacterium]|nr:hypothetical protein [Chloroflexota bacterium]
MTPANSGAAPVPENAAVADRLGRRILLWGGGGKTTLSLALGEKLDLPVVELDAINWLPGWIERDADEFQRLTQDAISGHPDGWVVDGNYGGKIGGAVLGLADTLIWLQLPFRTVFWRAFIRSVQRAHDKQKICGDNVESWRQTFLSRDSLLLFLLKRRLLHHRAFMDRRHALIREYGAGMRVIRLKSAKALDRFYEEHGLVRP